MRIKNINLEYWVFYPEFNSSGNLKKVNILQGMAEEIAKEKRRGKITCRHDLYDYLKRKFIYRYWSKVEYEYIVGDLWARNIDLLEKKDVYYQIEDNLTMITDYVIARMEITFGRDDHDETTN